MQLFLIGYFIISLCEIFTIGGFPLNPATRRVYHLNVDHLAQLTVSQGFSAVHIAAVVATTWVLLLNAVVGFQILEDGTPLSLGLILFSSLILFIGTGYIALDTGFSWTSYWDSTLEAPNRSYSLYTLYLLLPLIFIVVFFLLEAVLVSRVLGERRPISKFSPSSSYVPKSASLTLSSQSTSSAQLSSSPSVKSFNSSSACTSAKAPTAKLMVVFSRPSSIS